MGRKKKEPNFLETEQKMLRDLHIQAIKDNDVLNRLSNLSSKDPYNYNNLITWLYGKVKEYIPVGEGRERIDNLSTMTVIKRLSEGDFETFLALLYQYEMRISLEESTVELNKKEIDVRAKTDRIKEKVNKRYNEITTKDYISFKIARYALTDVIEELHSSNVKDIIVTKEDDNLVVKYKPSWRK